jgi:hypothetical protein
MCRPVILHEVMLEDSGGICGRGTSDGYLKSASRQVSIW